jgi:hypothetical protein
MKLVHLVQPDRSMPVRAPHVLQAASNSLNDSKAVLCGSGSVIILYGSGSLFLSHPDPEPLLFCTALDSLLFCTDPDPLSFSTGSGCFWPPGSGSVIILYGFESFH